MLRKSFYGVLAALSLFVVQANAVVQVNAQDELPAAEKVLDRYIKETGGIETYKAIESAQMKGKMSIPAANLSGDVAITFVAPNKFHFKADMGALGVQERGSNGKVIWENSTLQGARLIEGDEAEQLMQEISMASILNPKKYYKSMKTVGKEKVKGEDCYVLDMTRKSGDVDKDFYSVKTGLKIKSIKTLESPLGKMKIEGFSTNYKKSKNGILSSWTGEQKVGPNSIIVKMSSVEFNEVSGDQSFELPAEVKELVDE